MQTHEWEELLYETPADHLPGKKAVAEVIRLRREIEALCLDYAPIIGDLTDEFMRGVEYTFQVVTDDLANILEGEA